MSQTSPAGGDAAADAVAAELDRIAELSTNAEGVSPANAKPASAAPPAGPSLEVNDWLARTLRLIDSLKKPDDTKPEQVARTLGIPLFEQDSAHRTTGQLVAAGTYSVWSDALYREHPNKWTVGLSQQSTGGKIDCLFPLETLRTHVLQLGYKATEGVIRRDGSEHALFRSPASNDGVIFVVEVKIQRTAGEQACIQEIEIDANTREEGA
ncbi:hypothetical protein IEQ11_07455 [Lysobacter capsici]|uniref:hypothetical protein n=1 Tax=Lysobacter capsici TaxID=435897 RepID=UPI0017810CE8|nr:hypothetical protein [Lysobacter capsici]UOF16477.1 hypothetical protein IEQ11_07455 [Lysobacter capsici]